MKLSKELKTGIIVLGGILLFIMGFSFLKSNPIFGKKKEFFAIYDNVEGLVPSSNVTINGLPVGKVTAIEFKDKTGKLLVTFSLEKEFDFSVNSKVELYEPGLISGKALMIVPAFDGAALAKNGDTLTAAVKPGLTALVNETITPLREKIESMLGSADSLMLNVNSMLDDDTKRDFRNSLKALNQTVVSFNNTSKTLNELVSGNKQKLDNTIGNIDKITTDLSKTTDALAKADLQKTVADLQKTVNNFNSVLAKVDKGEGSLGKLLKDEGLYTNLSGASKQLEALLEDMKLNPKRYVHFSLFGKKQVKYEAPGETDDAKQDN
ncbi:MlaD family protein [Spongiivirga sp. MCCC 1A20706]|uniref:MlaD family protein n=1 Tax=Spongiivirga sp. MCCC 1A20706 TaxID=3160963 RepID=UPI0039773B57